MIFLLQKKIFFLNLPIHYLEVKKGFNVKKKFKGRRTSLLNKLDLM